MKYMQSNMSLRGVLPSSVQDWLDHELEVRGIDAVIYTRYILMILQEDSADEDQPETELFNSAHIRPTRYKQEKRKATSVTDNEERKKNAAVECLLSVSEQKNGIENLVEEICLKLKNIQSEQEHSPEHNTLLMKVCSEGSDNTISTSSEDLAQKYYAAFPALKASVDATTTASPILHSSVWCGKKITNTLSSSLQGKLKNDLNSSETKEKFLSKENKTSLAKRHGNTPSRYPCSGSCIRRISSSKFSSLERLGTSNKTVGSKNRLLRPIQRSRTRAKDSSYKSENLERLQGIKKCCWLKETTSVIPAAKKDGAAIQMLKKDLLVRPPWKRVDKLISGGHSKDTHKKAMHGKVCNNLKEGLKNNNFQESEDHLKINNKLSSTWDHILPIIIPGKITLSAEQKDGESQENYKSDENIVTNRGDKQAHMNKSNYIFNRNKVDDDLEGLSQFSEKFTSDVAAIWENKSDSYFHFPYYKSTYFSLTSLNDNDPLLGNGEVIDQDLISGIQSFQLLKDFSNENLSHLNSYLSSCKYSRSGLLDFDFDAEAPGISVFDNFYSKNCRFFETKLWDENNKTEFDFSWHKQEMFIEGGVYGNISLPFEDDTWKATCFDLKFLKPKIECPLFDDNDLHLFNFLDYNESFSSNLNSVWDFEMLKTNLSDKKIVKKVSSHTDKKCKKSVIETDTRDKELSLKENCFVEVQHKINSSLVDSKDVDPNTKLSILSKDVENEEQENLLISQRTHFRPIREESLEETLSDATTTNTECSDEVLPDISPGKPKFTKSDSGTLCIEEEEGQSPKKYMLYHGNDVTSTDDTAFIPKFKMSNLEKFCQTEEYIASEFDKINEVEIADETENLLTDSLQNIAQTKKEITDISTPVIPTPESPLWECEIDIFPITLSLSQQSNELDDEKLRKSETQDFDSSDFSLSWGSNRSVSNPHKWHYLEKSDDITLLRDELKEEEDQLLNDINSLREFILTDSESIPEKNDIYHMDSTFQHENKTRVPLTTCKKDHINHGITSFSYSDASFSFNDVSEEILLQEKENVTSNLPFIPSDKILYSSELEEFWQNDNHHFDVQIPKKRPKSKQIVYKKPCSFHLEGNCRRADCKFAHDFSTITCRFWEEGSCFKGITCPFLHGYSSNAESVDDLETIFSLDLDSEEFPALCKSQEQSSTIGSFPFFTESKKKKSERSASRTSGAIESPHGNKISKKLKGKSKSSAIDIKLWPK